VSTNTVVSSSLPDFGSLHQVPEAILSTRMRRRGDTEVPQLLIKWSHLGEELATWKDNEAMQQQFPTAPAWGQPGSQDPGGGGGSGSLLLKDAGRDQGRKMFTCAGQNGLSNVCCVG
jgi:hypothetical protein